MLKIESDSVILNGKIENYFSFLCNLNNYKLLFPKDKISNWESTVDSCSLRVQNVYTLEMIKVDAKNNNIDIVSGESSPFKFSLKIELNENENTSCSAKIICEANLSSALKLMVGKPLNELFNYMALQIEDATKAG
jgi:hypothetical protein